MKNNGNELVQVCFYFSKLNLIKKIINDFEIGHPIVLGSNVAPMSERILTKQDILKQILMEQLGRSKTMEMK